MPDTRSQWHPEEFADGLRAANPDAAHLSSHELIAQTFDDMPDAFGLTPDGHVQRRQWTAKEFVGGLREANPEHAHLPARDLIKGFIDENPGSFTLANGVVSLN